MATFPSYSTGTVSVSAGDTQIVGIGTIWSGTNARSGDAIVIAGHMVVIQDATDATHLVIDPWPHAGVAAGASYKIIKNSPLRFAGGEAMADVSRLVAALDKDGFYHFVGPTESAPDPSLGDDGQYARKPSTGEEWLKIGGVWVSQGFSGNYSFNATPWSSGSTYTARVIVPRAGKLYVSLQSNNSNHPPESSPSWWQLFMTGGDAYDIPIWDTDRPDSGELVFKLRFTKQVVFYAALAGSMSHAEVAPTGTVFFSFRKNGVQFGTLTFSPENPTGFFAAPIETTFLPGDILLIIAPAARDPTLSGIAATLTGYRS